MKKQNFLSWYYGKGISEFLEICKDLLSFLWRFFSIGDLFGTLFYPWKKDVVFRYWRGWRPLKSFEILIDNLFSRFIGSIVRLAVIFAGLVVIISFLILSTIILFAWLVFPIAFLFIVSKLITGSFVALTGIILLLAFAILVYLSYKNSSKIPYSQMDIGELSRQKWFNRVYHRMGIIKKETNPDIFKNPESLEKFLKSLDLTVQDFGTIVNWEANVARKKENAGKFWLKENLQNLKPIGKYWKYAYTAHLDEYTTDLSAGDPTEYEDIDLTGRQEELEILKLILARPTQNSALIVGNSGTGKNTMVHYLAKLIRRNIAERPFEDVRILRFDLGKMISSVINSGKDVDSVLDAMFAEVTYAGNVILFIENIENYLGRSGDMFHPDVSSVMIKYLPLQTFQIIATSTEKEYHNLVEKHEQFMKYIEVIEMKEPSDEETVKILLQNFAMFERRRVIFTFNALRHIVACSKRYRWETPLPERTLDVATEALMYWQKNSGDRFITPETVDQFLTLKTGMPQGEIKEEEKGKLLNLEEILHKRVIGQEEAVRQAAEALRRARTGIGNSQRPIGSFLFLGPTGVGKTETAKALAAVYFGDEEKMIRLDMSEFQTPSSIDRLIGSSSLNQPGRLITKAKDHPYSLLLLDEIEKAYPDILDIFLQVLDEGYVTDAFGEKVSFRNMIIIATTNAGAPIIKHMVEEARDPEDIKASVVDWTVNNSIFRLEFLNRFDEIIFFRPLGENELKSVVKLMINKFARCLQEEKGIEIGFNDDIVDKIINAGYDPAFGARSLHRYVEDKIEDLVAKKIIAGELKKGEKVNISL